MTSAQELIEQVRQRGWTLAAAESLTAGLVAASVAEVPGCSDVLRGGIVAYQPEVKARLLGVSPAAIAAGVVSRVVAMEMARGVRHAFRADVGLSTTGVAGPEPHDGEPVGSVWIAVETPSASLARHLELDGDRDAIRRTTVRECWALLEAVLSEPPTASG